MSYVSNVLTPGEKVIHEAKISIWAFLPKILLGIITLPLFGFGLLIFLSIYLKIISTELVITNKRIIAKFGLIRRHTIELGLQKIEGLRFEQGIFGRMAGYGTLIISGMGTSHAPIPGILDPIDFKKAFMQAQESSQGAGQNSSPAINTQKSQEKMKRCPFCAEEVLSAAIKCKHCQSDLAQTVA